MAPRVRIVVPPGELACRRGGEWQMATDENGEFPFRSDLAKLRAALPSDEMRRLRDQEIADAMRMATVGDLPGDLVKQMQCAPDVCEIILGRWMYKGGEMHTRMYFSEPWNLPGKLVALRLRFKRPGLIGVEEQDQHAFEASDLLLGFHQRNYL